VKVFNAEENKNLRKEKTYQKIPKVWNCEKSSLKRQKEVVQSVLTVNTGI
jgi:hypothetical protein